MINHLKQVFLQRELSREEDALICPNCKCSYNHIKNVTLLFGDDDYESAAVTFGGNKNYTTSVLHGPIKTPTRNRSLSLAIHFSCEECGPWTKSFLFHKGVTFENSVKNN